jgi:hypothetical protein
MYTDCRIYGLFQRCQVTLILCLWVIVAVVTQVPAAESPSAALRCGIAKADITPTKPVQMAGYGSRKELSQGVHDPLSARVVAFECGGKRAVLVSLDNLGFYNDTATQIRAALLERCKLEPSELMLCAIHTHSAPTLTLNAGKDHPNNVEYTKTLTATIGDLIERALKSMEPVSVGARRGYSPVGMNRREKVTNDDKTTIRLGRNPYGPTDKEVLVMKIAKADGTTLAAIFDYACHSTSLGPGNMAISGDVHGLAEQFVEKNLGGGVTVPAFAGASGDIDPWFRVVPGFKTDSGWVPEPVLLSTMLGEEVANIYRDIKELSSSGPVRTTIATLDLPAQTTAQDPSEYTGPAKVTITVARIGDTAFIGFGCEMLHALGLEIKLGSPFKHTFLITHCNGAAGYLAPAELYAQGGYEIQTSPFASEAAGKVVERAVAMLRELYKNE